MLNGIQPLVVSFPPKSAVSKRRGASNRSENHAENLIDNDLMPGQQPTAKDLSGLHDLRWTIPAQLTHRAAVTDAMWGAGMGLPGAETILARLLGQLPLHPASLMLDMACEQGGVMRLASQHFGTRTIGLTATVPCDSDLDIQAYTQSLAPLAERFDAVLVPMILNFLVDKPAQLAMIAGLLRPRGHLALLEMTLDRPMVTTAFSRWMDQEPVRPAPISLEVLKSQIVGQGMTIVRVEDVTSLYAEAIRNGLKKLSDVPWAQDRSDPRYAIMQSEAIDWATRLAALGQGLRVHAIHAVRPPEHGDLSFAQSSRDDVQ